MDTLTHALSGALLNRALTSPAAAEASPRERRWFGPRVPLSHALVIGLLAAALPDSDVVLKYVSDLAYLRGHRGITHSLVMLPLWSLLIGGLFALLFRRRDAYRRYVWLTAAAIAIHIAGDWITQFGTMMLAPLSDIRFGLGSVFIIDLTFSGIIVAGLVLSLLWRRSRLPAVAALALLPLWVGVTTVGKQEAIAFGREYATQMRLTDARVDAAPRPASPFNWTVVVTDANDHHIAHINTRRTELLTADEDDFFIRRFSAPYRPRALAQWERIPIYGEPAVKDLAREVWQHPEFAFFRWFSMFPAVYRVEHALDESCVWFRDLRFSFPGRNSVPFRYGMCRQGSSGWQRFAFDDIAGRAALP